MTRPTSTLDRLLVAALALPTAAVLVWGMLPFETRHTLMGPVWAAHAAYTACDGDRTSTGIAGRAELVAMALCGAPIID